MIKMRVNRFYYDKIKEKWTLWDSIDVKDKKPKRLTNFWVDDNDLICKDVVKILK